MSTNCSDERLERDITFIYQQALQAGEIPQGITMSLAKAMMRKAPMSALKKGLREAKLAKRRWDKQHRTIN